jgi:aquaporin Z
MRKYFAELVGTMVLVLMGCGAAVFAGAPDQSFISVGTLGVAFAFGLAVLAMVYTIGKISGCHINPAITLGVWLSGRMSGKDAALYMVFQVAGAILGSAILWVIADGSGLTATGANGFGEGHLWQALIAEVVFTFIFVLVVLGVTSKGADNKFAGIAIGLALVLVHIVCIPITGTSVNPARSIGPAIFAGGVALQQLWVFIVAPLVGGAVASVVWRALDTEKA